MTKVLIVLVLLVAVLSAACASVDKALLKPEVDPATNEVVFVHKDTGEKKVKSEVEKLPAVEQGNFEPSYGGPKKSDDWKDLGFDGAIAGVSIPGTLAIIAGLWWAIRRKRKKSGNELAAAKVEKVVASQNDGKFEVKA